MQHRRLLSALLVLALPLVATAQIPCEDGFAGEFACENVDLLAQLPLSQLSDDPEEIGSSLWGWTDPDTGKEYAVMGMASGTAFVDVSTPTDPVVLGFLPTESVNSRWREIKTVGSYAYIVSDAAEDHGMQVFDLTRLRDVTDPPETFGADAVYAATSFHNVVALEEAELVFVVGGTGGGNQCSTGLEIVDVSDPLDPAFVGCYVDEINAYIHDAQCVRYEGPDADYIGRDICFNGQADTGGGSVNNFVAIVDITDPSSPELISRVYYPNASYTHQGWLTGDGNWFIVDDELDELNNPEIERTRTIFLDVSDLDNPDFAYVRRGETDATDHNQFVQDGYLYQSNYVAGLWIWDVRTPEDPESVNPVAWFDVYPEDDNPGFHGGTWNNYPFFESGIVIVSTKDRGLFVLQPTGLSDANTSGPEIP